MRLQILQTARMKMTAFWNGAPCSLVEIDRSFKDAYCSHSQGDDGDIHPLIALMMEAVGTSETSVYFHETTQRDIAESCHLHQQICFGELL
jgi:hypothetical protein